MTIFNPANVKKGKINKLTDLEFRVYALHFSPKRTDCVDLGYIYELDEENHKAYIDGIDIFENDDSTLLNNVILEYYPLPKGNYRELITNKLKQIYD